MLTLTEAIAQGKLKSSQAREVKFNKALLKPMTPTLFIRIFERNFKEAGFGIPAGVTKKDRGMLTHLIKSEVLSRKEVAELAKDLVSRWRDDIAEHEFCTVANKKMTMPTRPNLRAFLYCKNDIISSLTEDKKLEIYTQDAKRKPIMPV